MSSPPLHQGGAPSDAETEERQRVNNVLETMMGEFADEEAAEDSDGSGEVRLEWLVNAGSAEETAMEGAWVDEAEDDDDYFDDAEYLDDDE